MQESLNIIERMFFDPLSFPSAPKKTITVDEQQGVVVTSTDSSDVSRKDGAEHTALVDAYNKDISDISTIMGEVLELCEEQCAQMSIPAGPVSKEAKLLGCKNDVITFVDYKRISDFNYNNPALGNNVSQFSQSMDNIQNIDFMDMLWHEILIRICEWLVDSIPSPVDKLLSKWIDKLKEQAEEGKSKSLLGALSGSSTPKDPLDLEEISSTISATTATKKDYTKAIVATKCTKKVVDYVRNYISQPIHLNFNPIAMEAYSISRSRYRSFLGVQNTFNALYGVDNSSNFGAAWKYDKAAMKDWGSTEWSKMGSRFALLDTDVYKDLYGMGVVGLKNTLKDTAVTLKEYATSEELACCLLGNLGSLASSEKTLLPLKVIRLALRYTFNGLNLNIGKGIDLLINILNQLISQAMGKIVSDLTGVMDDAIQATSNHMKNYISKKGDVWKRCYPFDELMQVVIRSMDGMKVDILAYVQDWANMCKITNLDTATYMAHLKKREFLRKAILLTDMFSKGIYSGAVCSALGNKEYAKPTTEELDRFNRDYRYRTSGITAHEAVNKFGRTPITGQVIIDNDDVGPTPSDSNLDKLWLQNCDLTMSGEEWNEFSRLLSRALEEAGR